MYPFTPPMCAWREPLLLTLFVAGGCGGLYSRDGEEHRPATDAMIASAGGTPGSGGAESSGGSSGSGGADSSSGGAAVGDGTGGAVQESPIDISGRWGMFGFNNPISLEIEQDGNVLRGRGCAAAFREEGSGDCGPLVGNFVDERHAEFAFGIEAAGAFMFDVFISEDGSRMAGPFHDLGGWGRPTAFHRMGPEDTRLPPVDLEFEAELEARVGWFVLSLADRETLGAYTSEQDYEFQVDAVSLTRGLAGDLGAFWLTELSWDEAEETLIAGPVVETHPDLPIELRLQFDGVELIEVTAILPSGDRGSFSATPETFD